MPVCVWAAVVCVSCVISADCHCKCSWGLVCLLSGAHCLIAFFLSNLFYLWKCELARCCVDMHINSHRRFLSACLPSTACSGVSKAKIKNIKISGFRTYGFFSCSNARFHTLNGELSSFAKRNLDKWEKLRSISSLSVLAISLLITTVKSLLIYCVCIWHFKRLTVWLRDRWRPPFCFYSSQAAQEQYSMLTLKICKYLTTSLLFLYKNDYIFPTAYVEVFY